MPLQLHPYSVLLAVAVVVATVVGAVAWRRRTASAAALPLCALMMGLAVWSGSYATGWASTSRTGQLVFLDLTYIGVGVVPAAFLIFALRLTGASWPDRKSVV